MRSRLRPIDLLLEILSALSARPPRTLLSIFGTAIGVASLVATVGIARTAAGQVVEQLAELATTYLEVAPTPDAPGLEEVDEASARLVLPADAPLRLSRLPGVHSATSRTVVQDNADVSARPPHLHAGSATQMPIIAVSTALMETVEGKLAGGRFFDTGHDRRGDAVAVIGRAAAQRLGIGDVRYGPAVFVDGVPITIIGVLAEAPRDPELLSALIIPEGLRPALDGRAHIDKVLVRIVPGSASHISRQVTLSLSPTDPTAVRVTVDRGADPRVAAAVGHDLQVMLLLLGGTALLAGAAGITNLSLVSVMERQNEIGLRRAVGAQRHHVGLQFLGEAAGIGALGGVCGCAAGVLAAVVVSYSRGWAPVLDGWLAPAAVGVGLLVGVLAGAYPASRAARIQPAIAVRR